MKESGTTVRPDVEARLRAASAAAKSRLTAWGPQRVLHGSALGLVLLGAILPIASVAQISIFSATTSSMRFYDFGLGGWLLLALGAGLAAAPFILKLAQRAVRAAFGLACTGIGMLLVPYALDHFIAMFAQLAPGYYSLMLAFLLLIVAYWQSAPDPLEVPIIS